MTTSTGYDWSKLKAWELIKKEHEAITERRQVVKIPASIDQAPIVGLAFSGGGVRSATFAFGFFQVIADKQLLKYFDYLSTVSGGGFLGGFLGKHSLSLKQNNSDSNILKELQDSLNLQYPDGPALEHLRKTGNYLSFDSLDRNQAYASFFINFICFHVVLVLSLVVLFGALSVMAVVSAKGGVALFEYFGGGNSLRTGLSNHVYNGEFSGWVTILLALMALFGGCSLLGGIGVTLLSRRARPQFNEGMVSIAKWAAFAALLLLPTMNQMYQPMPSPESVDELLVSPLDRFMLLLKSVPDSTMWLFSVISGIVLLGHVSQLLRKEDPSITKILLAAAGSVATVWILFGVLWLAQFGKLLILPQGAAINGYTVFGCFVALLAVIVLNVSIGTGFVNRFSAGAFLSSRIARSFLASGGRTTTTGAPEDRSVRKFHEETDDMQIDEYKTHTTGFPVQVICTSVYESYDDTINAQYSEHRILPMSVSSVGFVADDEIGGLWEGKSGEYRPIRKSPATASKAADVEVATSLSLADWLAASAAAVGPGMGGLGRGTIFFWLGLRLGWWWQVRKLRRRNFFRSNWTAALGPHVREFLCSYGGCKDRHWYLSDGGHFENTGAFELLRRRVKYGLVLDATLDGSGKQQHLADLIRLAREHLGVEGRILTSSEIGALPERSPGDYYSPKGSAASTGVISTDPKGTVSPHYVTPIMFSDRFGYEALFLFVRPVVTDDASFDVTTFAAKHKSFPNSSTFIQSFTSEQWESYRKLGETIGRRFLSSVKDEEDQADDRLIRGLFQAHQ